MLQSWYNHRVIIRNRRKNRKEKKWSFYLFSVSSHWSCLLCFFAVKAQKNRFFTRILPAVILAVAAIAMIGISCMRTVPTGHTGIVTTFGRVEDITYEAGVHFCAPWQSVVNMDNRNQKQSIDLSCFSSDIQEVAVTYTLNYQISKTNAQTIYKEIGVSYYETVILPRVQEAVKSELAKYTAEELLSNRAQLSADIKTLLTEKLSAYNIVVLDASMENLDFSDAFTDAVEAKQVAEQKSKQAQIEQQQKTMEANAAAERAEIEANAAAEVSKIQADAAAEVAKIQAAADAEVIKTKADAAEYAGEKDAEVIRQIRDTLAVNAEDLTDDDIRNLLLYYYTLQWNGQLPETYFGSSDFYQILAGLLAQRSESTAPGDTSASAGSEAGA